MENRSKVLEIASFIDLFNESSGRSRKVLTLLITASFLTLVALINSFAPQYNWFKRRSSTKKEISQWIAFPEEKPAIVCMDGDTRFLYQNKFTMDSLWNLTLKYNMYRNVGNLDSVRKLYPKSLAYGSQIKVPLYKGRVLSADSSITSFNSSVLVKELPFLKKSKDGFEKFAYLNRKDFENNINNLNRATIENSSLVNIPILGMSFDVNCLSSFSAVAFSILYFLLYFSLLREKKNITLLFSFVDHEKVNRIRLYQLISMKQVLTIPPSINEVISGQMRPSIHFFDKVFKLLPLLPLIMPAVIWLCVASHDLYTNSIGVATGGENLLYFSYGVSWSVGVIMFVCFGMCCHSWRKINKQWAEQANLIYKNKDTIPQSSSTHDDD